MIHYFVKKTDDFICLNMKNIFENLESNYQKNNLKLNLFQELKNLEFDPFVSITSASTKFEKSMKLKLKIIIGIFFVFIPLVTLLSASHLIEVQYTYSFLITFIIAIFASIRTNKIATRYSNFRHSS